METTETVYFEGLPLPVNDMVPADVGELVFKQLLKQTCPKLLLAGNKPDDFMTKQYLAMFYASFMYEFMDPDIRQSKIDNLLDALSETED